MLEIVRNVFDVCRYITRAGVRGGWTLEIKSFLDPVKWHRAYRQVPFGTQKTRDFQSPTTSHLPKKWMCPHQKSLRTGTYKAKLHRWFYVRATLTLYKRVSLGGFRAHTVGRSPNGWVGGGGGGGAGGR